MVNLYGCFGILRFSFPTITSSDRSHSTASMQVRIAVLPFLVFRTSKSPVRIASRICNAPLLAPALYPCWKMDMIKFWRMGMALSTYLTFFLGRSHSDCP